ncbi:type II toxin-antitoxin system HipA family toxin YjjJ [Aliidiomarina sp.]|uniref:type II toxin-antitoxin system HipA family toxin YjjJ n=1 Tax=Aliidiomarina sp. TaxID=1872439 RepID=UPI003A4DE5DF
MSTLKAGPMSASELARRFEVNPTTITRRLNTMSSEVVRAGAGRAIRWYLPRTLPLLDNVSMLPIYRVNSDGDAEKIAHLHVVYPYDSYLVEYFRVANHMAEPTTEWDFYESLPWWLTDMRPQGFLGRSFAYQLRSAGELVDANPAAWSEDTILAILAKYPQDHVGNLLVGNEAYERWLRTTRSPLCSDAEAGEKAEAIARGEHFDSSAQGEQPKFTARLAEGECIIKFSGRVAQVEVDSVANRWADLLHAEWLAATTLNQALPSIAAANRSFTANQRTLLASQRFDRTAQGGRVGVISFASLDAEFVGKANEPWPVIADALHQEKVLTEMAVTRCKVAWAFGQLIANSDMHLGNISAVNMGGRPFELAPIYDMLPMHYSPKSSGDLPVEPYQIRISSAISRLYWEVAYPAAMDFWQRVLEHPNISKHFKQMAEQQLHVVREFESIINRMA